MKSKLWSAKGAALVTAVTAGAVIIGYLFVVLTSPEPVSSAALGPEWQCSRVVLVLTTCTRADQTEGKVIPVRVKDELAPEL